MRNQPIAQVMTAPAWVIGPESTLAEAARLMARERLHHLPVVEGGRLIGIISVSDLIGREGRDAGQQRIGTVMERDPVTLGQDGTLQEAAELLASGNRHSLPITDPSGKVVGMVTTTDLVILLLRDLPSSGDAARREDALRELEQVRHAAELYLRSGQGEHEHAALVRALEKAREHQGPTLPTGRL